MTSQPPTAAMAADWIDPVTLTRAEVIALHKRNAATLAGEIARLGDAADPASCRARDDLAAERDGQLELADLARHFEYPHQLAELRF